MTRRPGHQRSAASDEDDGARYEDLDALIDFALSLTFPASNAPAPSMGSGTRRQVFERACPSRTIPEPRDREHWPPL